MLSCHFISFQSSSRSWYNWDSQLSISAKDAFTMAMKTVRDTVVGKKWVLDVQSHVTQHARRVLDCSSHGHLHSVLRVILTGGCMPDADLSFCNLTIARKTGYMALDIAVLDY